MHERAEGREGRSPEAPSAARTEPPKHATRPRGGTARSTVSETYPLGRGTPNTEVDALLRRWYCRLTVGE